MTAATPSSLEALLARAEGVLARLEGLLPEPAAEPDWSASIAFRYRKRPAGAFGAGTRAGVLEPVRHVAPIALDNLQEVDAQKERLRANTRAVRRRPLRQQRAADGARAGTGKSSLIKACLHEFAPRGLRLIEVDKTDLVDLPDIVALTESRPERFIVYCDDLSFDEGEAGYKALKSMLDGTISASSDNVLVYATSNRRHLLPEHMKDNLAAKHDEDGELHPGEAIEEKISLSERFGLWISFYPFSQPEYLAIVGQWLRHFGLDDAAVESLRAEALVWALERGSRSGRVAYQFARDRAGRLEVRGMSGKPAEVSDADRRAHTAIVDSEDAPSHYGDRPITEVAVGVLVDADGRFLLTSRPAGKVYAGYWEFPGGKLEAGETVEQALRRELHEEIGITIGPAQPWHTLMMDYPHARVRLNFCKVFEWTGAFEMREGQHMAWEQLPVQSVPVLPGTIPVLEWFAQERGFTGATHRG